MSAKTKPEICAPLRSLSPAMYWHSKIPQKSQNYRLSVWCGIRPLLVLSAFFLLLAGLASADEQLTKSGTVNIHQVQIAWIGSANLGGGTLQFNGQTYNFSVGGLGIGGFGVSELTATGEVYNLSDIANFAGAYVQGRWGFALGDISKGELWIRNDNGVYLHLKAQREGLALSLGGDALYINLDS